jgi:hypothetical protein
VSERGNRVTVGDELLGHHRELVTDLPEAHEHAVHHGLRADELATERVSVGLDPRDVVGEQTEDGGDVALANPAYRPSISSLFVSHPDPSCPGDGCHLLKGRRSFPRARGSFGTNHVRRHVVQTMSTRGS